MKRLFISGEYATRSFTCIGTIQEIPLDKSYVGWLIGQHWEVIQDLSLRSGTRVDLDLSDPNSPNASSESMAKASVSLELWK